MAEAPESWEYVDPSTVYPTYEGGELVEVRVSEDRTGVLCDSCGADVSPAALHASKGLDHVSPEAAVAIEMQFKVKAREIHLCAECFIAMYWMIVPTQAQIDAARV